MADYGLKPGERLVCGNCGAFLPSNISPETHGDWVCRCGEDWFVSVKRFAAPVRRAQRLPLTDAQLDAIDYRYDEADAKRAERRAR